MKMLFCSCLMAASSIVLAGTPSKDCAKFSPTDEVSAPLTIAEIERQKMAGLSADLKVRPDLPKVPFGFANPEWVTFKSMFRPGDKIVRYSTSRHSWQHLAGETGYGLLRSGCLIGTFRTMWN
jgi:hypothetical protein